MITAFRPSAKNEEERLSSTNLYYRPYKRRNQDRSFDEHPRQKINDGNILNSHIMKLRIQLLKKGYSEVQIEDALEAMWEKELKYHDCEEVVSYIRSGAAIKNHSVSKHNCPPEEETKTASTAESISISGDEAITSLRNMQNLNYCRSCNKAEVKSAPTTQDVEDVLHKRHPEKYTLKITSKLDLVADYENLLDAVFALSEWIAKAANPDQLYEFCSARKTRALPTIIRRSFSESLDQVKFEESVLPSVLHLIGSIFLKAGMSSDVVSSTRKFLDSVLKQSRKACLIKGDSGVFGERVARYVVVRIFLAIKDLKLHGSDEGVGLILKLEDEIGSLSSSMVTGEGGITELIAKRDSRKAAAEKSATVVGVAMTLPLLGFEMLDESYEKPSVEKQDIIVCMLGHSGVDSIKRNKEVHQKLGEKAALVTNKNLIERQNLQLKLATFHAEKKLVAERMEELRIAMRQLEEDDAELSDKILETRSMLTNLEMKNEEELGTVGEDLIGIKKTIIFEEAVDYLADCLKSYEESLNSAVTVSNIFENCENVEELVAKKLSIYLSHMKNYFTSESDCVHFLRNRVSSLEKETQELMREIDGCKALGMNATVSQMSDTLSLNRQNISDDICVINSLIMEAQNMLTNLLASLGKYLCNISMEMNSNKFSMIHQSLIRDIARTVEMMELENMNHLKAFLPTHIDYLPAVVTTSHDESDETSENDIVIQECNKSRNELYHTIKPIVVTKKLDNTCPSIYGYGKEFSGKPTEVCSQSCKKNPRKNCFDDDLGKKLTWANPTTQMRKPVVKSLREIQKEELLYNEKSQAEAT